MEKYYVDYSFFLSIEIILKIEIFSKMKKN